MKGVIIDNKEWISTQLSNIFPLIGNIQNDYNWPITLQHPLAELELIAWDSTETVLISKDDTIAERLIQQYDFVENMENYK